MKNLPSIVNSADKAAVIEEAFQILDESNAFPTSKIYRALVSQVGTDAPTAIVLENTIGEQVWTRLDNGQYMIALDDAFPVGKTFLLGLAAKVDLSGVLVTNFRQIGTGTIAVETFDHNLGGFHGRDS